VIEHCLRSIFLWKKENHWSVLSTM
jgi:hypothetical protein